MSPHQIKRLNNSRSLPLRLATGGVLGTLAVGGVVAVAAQKDVTVDINGDKVELATFAKDVDGALEAAGVQVSEEDIVSPAPSESVGDGDEISVRTAKPVAVTIDGVQQQLSTTDLTVSDLLGNLDGVVKGASVKSGDADVDEDAQLEEGMDLEVVSPKIVKINDGGKVTYTKIAAKTVEDVLKARNIDVDDDDRVFPSKDTKVTEGMSIKVDQVSTTTYDSEEEFDAEPNFVDDPELEEGTEEVREEGVKGKRVITHKLVMKDGAKESNDVIKEKVTVEPKAATIARGTKKAEEEKPEEGATPVLLLRRWPMVPSGIPLHSVRQPVTGPLIPATASPVACSSPHPPGQHSAAPSTRQRHGRLPASSRLPWQKRCRQRRAGAHGRHVLPSWACAKPQRFLAAHPLWCAAFLSLLLS